MKVAIVSDLIIWQSEFETKEGLYQELSWFGNEVGKESVEVRGVASRSSVTDHSCCM